MKTDTRTDLLIFDHEQDRKMLLGETEREPIESLSWSPDNRSLLFTIAKIISQSDGIIQSDVYRVDLPEHLISPQAAVHNGPPMGRPQAAAEQATETEQSPSSGLITTTSASDASAEIIETIVPQHISVEEALASLPGQYNQY